MTNQTQVNLNNGIYSIGLTDDVTINTSLKINNYTLPLQLNPSDANKIIGVSSDATKLEVKDKT